MNTKLDSKEEQIGEDEMNELLAPGDEKGNAALSVMNSDGGLSGDFDQSDVTIPYFSIVGKTGQLSDHFNPGSFVFNKEVEVADGKKPILVTALTLEKSYVEDIPFDPDVLPRRFRTKAEYEAEGYTEEWGADKRVLSAASIVCLIPVPDDYATIFAPTHLEEGIAEQCKRVMCGEPTFGFARAMWMVQSSAYTMVAKPMITAKLGGHLRTGLHHGPWSVTSFLKSNAKNSWQSPKVASAGKHSPAFIQWIEEEVML